MKPGEPVRIDQLPIEGLENLRQQLRQVLEAKQKGIEILANTAGAFDQSRSAIQDLSKLNDGKFWPVGRTWSLHNGSSITGCSPTHSTQHMILPQLKGAVLAGDKMMVPLTESLYVEGYVHEKDKILVDIGTGYFAEVCTQKYA